jgi:hypothetical protein
MEGHTKSISSIVVTDGEKQVFSGSFDTTIKAWDPRTGECILTMKGHIDAVASIVLCAKTQQLVSGSYDGTVKVWNSETGELLRTLESHSGAVLSVAAQKPPSPSPWIVSGSADHTIKVWNIDSGTLLHTLEGHTDEVNAVAIGPSPNEIVSGGGHVFGKNPSLKIWNVDTGSSRELVGHTASIRSVAVTPDQQWVVSGSSDKTVRMWDAATGDCAHTLIGHTECVFSVSLQDAKHLVSASADSTIRVWDLTGKCLGFTTAAEYEESTSLGFATKEEYDGCSAMYTGKEKFGNSQYVGNAANTRGSILGVLGGTSVNTAITRVVVEEGVTEIADGAFTHCPNLTCISMPATVATIGPKAFEKEAPFSTLLTGSPDFKVVGLPHTVSIRFDPMVAVTGHAAILGTANAVPRILFDIGVEKVLSASATAAPLLPAASEAEYIDFTPPRQQPRALQLNILAQRLQGALFQSTGSPRAPTMKGQCYQQDVFEGRSSKAMNPRVVNAIEKQLVPVTRQLFAACVQQSREMVPAMQKEYQTVRKGHLEMYSDKLRHIRQEPTFPEFHKRSDQLATASEAKKRPQLQLAKTVTDLCAHGEAVASRYQSLLALVAKKTGSVFHTAGRKELIRICEKLSMARSWEPGRVCDVVRGAIECDDFTTMISVIRLLRDLDTELKRDAAETGGFMEGIIINRVRNRFGSPTSGGWADIMINFSFAHDPNRHICEVQIVHTRLYAVKRELGAHKAYLVFRSALELCGMVGADPEEGVGPQELEALVWKDPVASWQVRVDTLEATVEAQGAKIEAQDAKLKAQNAKLEAQEAKNTELESHMQSMQTAIAALTAKTS